MNGVPPQQPEAGEEEEIVPPIRWEVELEVSAAAASFTVS